MSNELHDFSDADFEEKVLKSSQPVLVDFWAPWCGPCKALTPTIEKLATEYSGRMVVGKMDIQSHPQAAAKYGIRSIPALLFFKDGQITESLMGAAAEDKIREKMDLVLG